MSFSKLRAAQLGRLAEPEGEGTPHGPAQTSEPSKAEESPSRGEPARIGPVASPAPAPRTVAPFESTAAPDARVQPDEDAMLPRRRAAEPTRAINAPVPLSERQRFDDLLTEAMRVTGDNYSVANALRAFISLLDDEDVKRRWIRAMYHLKRE